MVEQKYDGCYHGVYRVRELGEHIVAHQSIYHSQSTFKGTQKLIDLVVESVGRTGRTIKEVAAYCEVPIESAREAVLLAAHAVREEPRLPNPQGEPGEPPLFKWKR